jgi:hypothetical protein
LLNCEFKQLKTNFEERIKKIEEEGFESESPRNSEWLEENDKNGTMLSERSQSSDNMQDKKPDFRRRSILVTNEQNKDLAVIEELSPINSPVPKKEKDC